MSPGTIINVPPRSSSFAGTRPQPLTPDPGDPGRKSRMTHRDGPQSLGKESYFPNVWIEEDATTLIEPHSQRYSSSSMPDCHFDLARTTPPLSPKGRSNWPHSPVPSLPVRTRLSVDSHRITSFETYYPEENPHLDRQDSDSDFALAMISALEESTSNFPSTMLLPDTPCIHAIQNYLCYPYERNQHSLRGSLRFSDNYSQTRFDIVQQQTTSSSLYRRASSARDSDAMTNSSINSDLLLSPFGPGRLTQGSFIPSIHQLNLQPLRNVFPASTPFLLAALFAHVLTYNFLTSLTSPTLSQIDVTRLHERQPSQNKLVSHIPTTTSYVLPPKVISVLGIPSMAARPPSPRPDVRVGAVGLRTSDGGMARVEDLREKIRGCIGWLIGEMDRGCKVNYDGVHQSTLEEDIGVNELLLKALAEIVRGMEKDYIQTV